MRGSRVYEGKKLVCSEVLLYKKGESVAGKTLLGDMADDRGGREE